MKTEASLTREMIAKMEEGLKETRREIVQMIASGQKEIAHLIVAEGERTRREIKT
ncbi:MAG: hypothetical protein AB1630_06475 [bacterium]